MSDDAVPDESQEDLSRWRPAIFPGLYLIAVSIVLSVFLLFYRLVLSNLTRPLWDFWFMVHSTSKVYPVLEAIYHLLFGAILLVLTIPLLTNKFRIECIIDDLQLTISKDAMGYLVVGSVLGIIAVVVFYAGQALSNIYLFNAQIYFYPWTERLAMAVLYIIPLLVASVGMVTLVQGYFQRVFSKHYGETAGLTVAVFCYMFLFGFPDLTMLLQSSSTELFTYVGAMIAGSFIQTIVIGLIVAYLFVRSKSLYVPIGFLFMWQLFFYFIDWLLVTTSIETIAMYQGYNVYILSYLVKIPLSLLILALVWYLGRDSQKGLVGLTGIPHNILDSFRFHDDDEE